MVHQILADGVTVRVQIPGEPGTDPGTPGTTAPGAPDAPGADPLPRTGADVALLLVLAALAIAVGWTLLRVAGAVRRSIPEGLTP